MYASERIDHRPIPLHRLVILAIGTMIVHGLLFRRMRVAGVGPEFFAALAIVGGLQLGVAGGAVLGALAGFGADMTVVTPVGIWVFVCAVIGLAYGAAGERAYSDSLRRPPVVLVAVGTVVALVLQRLVALAVVGASFPAPSRFATVLVVAAIWGAAIALPVHLLVRAVMVPR